MNDEKREAPKTAQPRPRRGGPMGMGGGPMGPMGGAKAKNFGGTMGKFGKHLKPFWPLFLVALLFAIAGTTLDTIGPDIMRGATNEIFAGVQRQFAGAAAGTPAQGIDFDYVESVILTLVAIYLASAALSVVMNWVLVHISQKITYKFRRDLNEKINRMPLKYFDGTTHGEVLSRVTNDVDTIGMSLSQSLSQSLTAIVSVVGVLVMMFRISLPMTMVALITIPISLGFVAVIVSNSQKYFKKQQKFLGTVNGQIEEAYGGHLVIQAFGAEDRAIEGFQRENEKLFSAAWRSQFFSGVMMPAMAFIGNLGYVAVCILGGFLVIVGDLKAGDILAFIQYMRKFTQPISQVAQIANVIQSTAAAAERVFEFMDEPEEEPDKADSVPVTDVKGSVTFTNVRFGYNPETVIIKNFSADVKQGMRVAIVGPTGAGKTTIVKLLMRYYDLNSGSIAVDGVNINDFSRSDLRSLVAMVLQDTWLFNGTVRENIRYGNLTADDETVKKAAKAARVHHFIRTLPGGYDMVLNEEASNISQGQKQLLTIARALLSDPKILILDEATSNVDTRTEVQIQTAMEELMKGRTSFIIAHRLSTIRGADWILVLNDGDIVEQGNHEDLLAAGGFYAALYNSQFEG